MKKIIILILGVLLFTTCSSTKEITAAAKKAQPNIVYILADDMGIGDIAALNPDAKVHTPNLDQLIADGMNFTDAHTASSVCTPTRYGLLTGRYSWRTPLKEKVLGGYSLPLIDEKETLRNLTTHTVDYIKKYDSEKPFFLYVPLTSPHTPVVPRKEFLGTSEAGVYGDFIQETDWSVGQILDAIAAKGLNANTLVIFTADNGASKISFPIPFEKKFGHHPSRDLKGRKGSLHEGGHRVPFVAKWTGKINPNSACDATICLNDLYATSAALSATTTDVDQGVDSYDFSSLLFGASQAEGMENTYQRPSTIYRDFGGNLAIRKGDWKLIMHPRVKKRGLYNLEEDVSEKNNLYGNKAFLEKETELTEALTMIIKNGRTTEGKVLKNDGEEIWKQLYWMN